MKRILLDTNAYVRLLSGNEDVLDVLSDSETVYMSAIVVGELIAGFRGGTRLRQNRAQLRQFLDRPTVSELPVTTETAEAFGQVKQNLQSAGTPIPMNDVWIAAQAIESGSVVITFDKHFAKVPGIRLWDLPD